jgi:glycopeptide antibiotics resistance protein
MVAWLTLLPLPIGSAAIEAARAMATYDHNAVPFATLATQLDGGLTQFELRQVAGNLLLLLPLGVYGPILWPAMRSVVVTAIVAAGVAGAIELAQLALATAYGFPVRVADVDDVLLNTFGALIGFVAWRIWPRGPIESRSDAVRDSADR